MRTGYFFFGMSLLSLLENMNLDSWTFKKFKSSFQRILTFVLILSSW